MKRLSLPLLVDVRCTSAKKKKERKKEKEGLFPLLF
jgi:hypothetical protein